MYNLKEHKQNQNTVTTPKLLPDQKDAFKKNAVLMEKINHKGSESMSFLESILSCDNMKTEEFHCLADYNCPFVVSWYSVGSNLLAN